MITVEYPMPSIGELVADFVAGVVLAGLTVFAVNGLGWSPLWLLLAGWFVRDAASDAGKVLFLLPVYATLVDAESDPDTVPRAGERP
jgi:hypothetical protein